MVQTQQSMKGKHYIPGETKAQRKERKRLAKQTPPSNGKNYVACLKWGDKYTSDYVNKLYAMVDRNITLPYEFVCFTENTKDIDKNITTHPLPRLQADGWWYKPMFVGNELPIKGTLLFLDLDVIVFKNIDKLFSFEPNKFVICRDFNRSIRPDWNRMNSSVFRTTIGQYDHLYQGFKSNTQVHITKHRGDQDWMYANIHDHAFWPDEWIMSYKWEMRSRQDLHIDTTTRKRNFKLDAPPIVANETSIAVFHGEPNPANANDTWVKEHWG